LFTVINAEKNAKTVRQQVAQLSQSDRAMGWVSFGQMISGRRHYAAKVVRARKLKH